jgi:archaellum component FlaF (FlaF/FlaG flagellin family)
LITYGWAILVILVVLAVLWYYGIFNPANWAQEQIKPGSVFSVSTTDKMLNGSQLSVKLSNMGGVTVNITKIEVLTGGDVTATSVSPNENVVAGAKSLTENLTVTTAPATGSLAKFTMKVSYVPSGGVAGTDTLEFSIKVG